VAKPDAAYFSAARTAAAKQEARTVPCGSLCSAERSKTEDGTQELA